MRPFVIPALAAAGTMAAAMLLALPSTAARRSAPNAIAKSACASLARVTSFHGSASLSHDAQASGMQPTTRGTLAIGIADGGLVRFTLTPTVRTADVTIFAGKVNGNIQIEHNYGWTNADGTPDGSGTVKGTTIGFLHSATLLVSRARCQYQITVGFSTRTTFNGDATVSNPGSFVTVGAQGPRRAIPSSLVFSGGGVLPVHETCGATVDLTPPADGCYSFSGGWANDFATLKLCQSTEPVNCASDKTAMGMASLTWHLVPVLHLPKRVKK